MVIGAEHALYQLAATIAFADAGSLPSRILMYTDLSAADGSEPASSAVAAVVLAKPCGTITAGVLSLHAALPGGTLVTTTGVPRAARWVNGDGLLVAAGTLTDGANGGDFTVSGGITAPGETSPTLYAGGLVLLGAVALT